MSYLIHVLFCFNICLFIASHIVILNNVITHRRFSSHRAGPMGMSLVLQIFGQIITIHPEREINVCTKFHWSPSNSFWDILVWTKVVNRPTHQLNIATSSAKTIRFHLLNCYKNHFKHQIQKANISPLCYSLKHCLYINNLILSCYQSTFSCLTELSSKRQQSI